MMLQERWELLNAWFQSWWIKWWRIQSYSMRSLKRRKSSKTKKRWNCWLHHHFERWWSDHWFSQEITAWLERGKRHRGQIQRDGFNHEEGFEYEIQEDTSSNCANQFGKESRAQIVLQSGKRILNVDQTWLGMSDFRRMKWRPKDSTNSIPKLSMMPRITMFVGLDTDGEMYLSLL